MLSKNVKRIRENEGLSQMELAEKANVFHRTISLIELGKTKNPRIDILEKIAKALNVTVSDLIK